MLKHLILMQMEFAGQGVRYIHFRWVVAIEELSQSLLKLFFLVMYGYVVLVKNKFLLPQANKT